MSIVLSLASTALGLILALEPQVDGGAPVGNPAIAEANVVLIEGEVKRPGAYALTQGKLLLPDLLVAAGVKGDRENLSVQLIRQVGENKQFLATIPMPLLAGDNPVTISLGPTDRLVVVKTNE